MQPRPPQNTQPALGEDQEANYDLFIARIQETGKVWGLQAKDGWAVCPSLEFENTDVFPFWSEEADAKIHCTEDWSIYTPRGRGDGGPKLGCGNERAGSRAS